jgi:hypothetical protein
MPIPVTKKKDLFAKPDKPARIKNQLFLFRKVSEKAKLILTALISGGAD